MAQRITLSRSLFLIPPLRKSLFPQTLTPHSIPHLTLLQHFSSKTSSSSSSSFQRPHSVASTTKFDQPHKDRSEQVVDDVTNQELKKRIEKYYEGDDDALPSIFEAILKRKLAGKHDESDDELLEEFGPKLRDDLSDKDIDSD